MADSSEVVSSTMEQGGDQRALAGPPHGVGDSAPASTTVGKANLLVVLGEPFTAEQQQLILKRLSSELQSWDVQVSKCDISQELQTLASTVPAVTVGVNGEKTIDHNSEAVSISIVINPTLKTLVQKIRAFLLSAGSYRHLIYSGRAIQKSGCWILQDALLSFSTFADLVRGADVAQALKNGEVAGAFHLNIFAEGEWANVGKLTPQLKVSLNQALQESDSTTGLNQFISYIQPNLPVTSTQDLLASTNVVGSIRFTRPTLYVFPGANGNSALFGISGFNLLIDGGYSRKACFWDFARHLDRIDALLISHIGADNLFGLGAVLARKATDGALRPDIGYVYMNAISGKAQESGSEAGSDKTQRDGLLCNLSVEASCIAEDVRQMGLIPHPLSAPAHGPITPVNLYHKIGHGTLDMYVLNPVHDSKALKDFMAQWSKHVNGFTSSGKGGAIPLSHTTSITALLVWKPASPNDAMTRILLPGATPQAAVFEGLDRLKTMALFQQAACSEKILSGPPKLATGGARKSISKPATSGQPPATKPAAAATAPAKQDNAHNVTKQAATPAPNKTAAKPEPKKAAPAKDAPQKAATSPTKPQPPKNSKQLPSAIKKPASVAAVKKPEGEVADSTAVAAELVQLVDVSGSTPVEGVRGEGESDVISSTEPVTDELTSPSSEAAQLQEDVVTDKVDLVEGLDADKDIDTANYSDGTFLDPIPQDGAGYDGVVPEGLPQPEHMSKEFVEKSESSVDEVQVEQDVAQHTEQAQHSEAVEEPTEQAEHVIEHMDAAEEADSKPEEPFDPQAQWGHPMGLPAPNKPPGKNDGNESQASGGAEAKKGATAHSKPPAKATNGKDQTGKLNESVNKPPSALGKKTTAPASRPQSSADHQASFSKDSKQETKPSAASSRPTSTAAAATKKAAPAAAKPAANLKPVVPFYVDLAYIPGHGGMEYVDGDFFRRVRARYYVLSTVNPDPQLLTALLDAKATWESGDPTCEVTLIPTYDADVLRYWMAAHRDAMSRLRIDVAAAANRCSIQLQDQEASCAAFRLEF